MNEPDEVKPNLPKKPQPDASPKYDLDLDSKELQIVKRSQEAANSALIDAAKQISNVYPKALAEQISQMARSMPKITLPDMLPTMPRYEPLELEYTIPENPSHETNRLLREMTAKLDNLKEQNSKLVAPNYDPDSCTIIFGNKLIKLKKNTKQADLCNALFSKPKKKWEWDEMLEHWGEREYSKDDWRKVYEAARSVNEKVAIKTGIEDLLDYDKFSVMLNSNYMP